MFSKSLSAGACAIGTLLASILATPALSQSLSFAPSDPFGLSFGRPIPEMQQPADDQSVVDELPAPLRRQAVAYSGSEPPGTIIVDTAHTYLYLTLGNGQAMRYGIGVGREGFTWSGMQRISRKAEWPDWIPPAQMVARQPYLPRWVGGGPGNPLGARALYLGNSEYRIHGTNDPTSIGKRVSSGCIRLRNEDIEDLYQRVDIGTKVVVLPDAGRRAAIAPVRREHVATNEAPARNAQAVRLPVAASRSTTAFGLY
ncbi:MAG: L,D-transpeptidase [Steroidobacteraceae bacterium]